MREFNRNATHQHFKALFQNIVDEFSFLHIPEFCLNMLSKPPRFDFCDLTGKKCILYILESLKTFSEKKISFRDQCLSITSDILRTFFNQENNSCSWSCKNKNHEKTKQIESRKWIQKWKSIQGKNYLTATKSKDVCIAEIPGNFSRLCHETRRMKPLYFVPSHHCTRIAAKKLTLVFLWNLQEKFLSHVLRGDSEVECSVSRLKDT